MKEKHRDTVKKHLYFGLDVIKSMYIGKSEI